MVWPGVALRGVARRGSVKCGVVWYGMVCGVVWYGVFCYLNVENVKGQFHMRHCKSEKIQINFL